MGSIVYKNNLNIYVKV